MGIVSDDDYAFVGGYPTPETAARAHDEADLVRAIWCYRFFYPTVSLEATWRGNLAGGVVPNEAFALLEGTPRQVVFTANSDTPYSGVTVDLSDGPVVVDIPPGVLMGTANDLNQLWVLDLGLPGPAKAAGGRHALLPPGWEGDVPDGVYAAHATTDRVLVLVRALPQHGDVAGAIELMKSVQVYPLGGSSGDWPIDWVNLSEEDGLDFSPVPWELGLDYWRVLRETLDANPSNPEYRFAYGELAALGIEAGKPFEPDARLAGILEHAARAGHAQLAAQSFADRRPERQVWDGTHWEWAVLQPESGRFEAPGYTDLYAREKWFYQAQIESPAMFARQPGAGSLYWLGLRDETGAYLDGGGSYTLDVPLPVPAGLFWSVTVYDARTRSELSTEQGKAALRSLVELADVGETGSVRLYFGPEAPADPVDAAHWIRTAPGVGWFVYFRIYGPQGPTFDGSWHLPDFHRVDD
ncbi:DUF1254 domain-containing protein [Luteimicrobium xylanilyticum]|uniref:DUF1254 domain-containing protein n=1 Tax=Luteimicrobium xylanilyticum TaxID=1133546 RepID=A0A5P9Q603_9MICO|nr:DUF1254 domain-containing protein [Luteimicrobium xylanilyticum]QFU96824.1 hypothetical protein KDY119_00314 [Luteimicrobium xylanilyticum]